jgi:hypothetical protein
MPPTTPAALGRVTTLLVAVGVAFSAAFAIHGADASAAGAPATGIVRPAQDQVVRGGKVKLVVAAKGGRVTKVDVDGVDVTRMLRRGPKGAYTAQLSLGRGLHYGINHVFVRRGAGRFQHSRFVVAKRGGSLLKLTALQPRTDVAPVRVALRNAPGTKVLAYVNGRPAERAFTQEGRLLVGRLGANDGLRFGKNKIRVLVHKTHPHRRQSTYHESSSTVRLGRGAPLASAGRDRTVTANSFTQLDGRASKFPAGTAGRSYKWKIVSAPRGSKAKLRRKATKRPTLIPDRPGRYRVRVTVRGKGKAARLTSTDTVLLTAMADLPPVGGRLETMTRDRGMVLNGTRIPATECCHYNLNYAVIDRTTLAVVKSGSTGTEPDDLKALGRVLDGYAGSQSYLVAINWVDFSDRGGVETVRNEFDNVLQKIGAQKLTDRQRALVAQRQGPGSAIGVAGAPAGSAFVVFPYRQLNESPQECPGGPCDEWVKIGNQSGALRLNGVVGKYDFVYTDFVDFDTEVNQTPQEVSPPNMTIKVGDRTFSIANPGRDDAAPGRGGFHLLRLNARTLESYGEFYYRTNTNGVENPGESQRLANDLNFSADQADRPLVVLQAYGYPNGKSPAWHQAARAVERLGGTRQVFLSMNATDPRAENGESKDRRGPYAFVGRVGMSAPRAEASYSLTGLPGRVRGVLMRARDGGFEPMLAAPARPDGQTTVNTELIRLTNQAPTSFPVFKDSSGQAVPDAAAQSVQRFLGGPQVTKLCSAAAPVCDIRKSYHQSFRADWASIQDDLTNAKTQHCPGTHQGFTADQCEGIRSQLRDEVSMVSKVARYLGPEGLQQPFGAASVAALADLGQISQEIKDAVEPPPANNTASKVLNGISVFLRIGGFAPAPYSQVAAGLSGVFAVGGYFTHQDGSPNLVGPLVTTAASKLGVDLAERYQQAGDNLDDIGRLLVSDYGKLSTLASKAGAEPGPGEIDWRLGSVGSVRDGLRRSAKQTIYQRLVPVAFPVMYDLGESGNARSWYCDGGIAYDKHLFGDQADGAQFTGRFEAGDWNPTIAVAQANATGRLHSARIPGVPAKVADVLFKDPSSGGIGMTKLEFYSPSNGFRWFPSEPSRKSISDRSGDWNTLNQFPTGRPTVIHCNAIPDPPGNAG